jgi:NAD(P)-dependent dehydrogenase (short-subunit alcohol dehydrogenase family)
MTTPAQDKIALITGCASGIGLETTRLFLSKAYHVFGVDLSPFPADALSSDSENFHFHQCDLTQANACDKAVEICTSKLGHVVSCQLEIYKH